MTCVWVDWGHDNELACKRTELTQAERDQMDNPLEYVANSRLRDGAKELFYRVQVHFFGRCEMYTAGGTLEG